MTEQHPITPPPELRQLWAQQAECVNPCDHVAWLEHVAVQAARWGADQELQACLQLLDINGCPSKWIDMLRAARRRPKPPSLAEQARAELDEAVLRGDCISTTTAMPILLAALERLQELESNG